MSVPGSHLTDVVERNTVEERQRALRALLSQPLLPRAHSAYALVRRHAETLRTWLQRETGWALIVEEDFARLRKEVANPHDTSRGARLQSRPGAPPFSRRRYALLCLALADLEHGENQITLGRLGRALMQSATDPELEAAGLAFSLEERDERRDLVAVARLLLELGVLARVAGEEESFVRSRERDVLYDVNRRVLSVLLAVARGPSQAEHELPANASLDERIGAICERFVPETTEARNAALRRYLTAWLLDEPVLYRDELDDAQSAYLASQRPHLVRRIEEATGLLAEVRAEGMAMVDPTAELSDQQLPSEGTDGHVTLLVADHLARARAPVPMTELQACLRGWIDQHRRYWRKAACETGAEKELCRLAVERLQGLRLVAVEGDEVRPLPAIGRHALGQPRILALSGASP